MWFYGCGALTVEINDSDQLSVSALYLCQHWDATQGLFVAFLPQLGHKHPPKIMATLDGMVDNDDVHWHELELVDSHIVSDVNAFISPFLRKHTLVPDNAFPVSVSVLRFRNPSASGVVLESLFPFKVSSSWRPRDPLTVISAPFATVNPAIFVGYSSDGTISYASKDRSTLFCDVRYMEGMSGGVALDKDGRIMGLVIGAVKKENGEGELTVVATLPQIVKQLSNYPKFDLTAHLTSGLEQQVVERAPSFDGVVALTVKRPGNMTAWGSGVLLDDQTVVTNRHVIDHHILITAWFGDGQSVDVRTAVSPLEGIDLVVLNLVRKVDFKPVQISSTPLVKGDKLTSIGYGIFYPLSMDSIFPLYSTGIVSKVVNMRLYDDSTESMPALIAASSGCWNGSSGGGVFRQGTNELVGLMSSNGRVLESGEIIPTMSFVIPVELVQEAIGLWRNGKTKTINERVERLWTLRATHRVKSHGMSKL